MFWDGVLLAICFLMMLWGARQLFPSLFRCTKHG